MKDRLFTTVPYNQPRRVLHSCWLCSAMWPYTAPDYLYSLLCYFDSALVCFQCFDAVGWASGRRRPLNGWSFYSASFPELLCFGPDRQAIGVRAGFFSGQVWFVALTPTRQQWSTGPDFFLGPSWERQHCTILAGCISPVSILLFCRIPFETIASAITGKPLAHCGMEICAY